MTEAPDSQWCTILTRFCRVQVPTVFIKYCRNRIAHAANALPPGRKQIGSGLFSGLPLIRIKNRMPEDNPRLTDPVWG